MSRSEELCLQIAAVHTSLEIYVRQVRAQPGWWAEIDAALERLNELRAELHAEHGK